MAWGAIEFEDEVAERLGNLDDEAFGQPERYIGLRRCIAEGHTVEEAQ